MKSRKLILAIDDLQVTTFDLGTGRESSGTVRANEDALVSFPRTCASQCWSMCLADTDCCPDTVDGC